MLRCPSCGSVNCDGCADVSTFKFKNKEHHDECHCHECISRLVTGLYMGTLEQRLNVVKRELDTIDRRRVSRALLLIGFILLASAITDSGLVLFIGVAVFVMAYEAMYDSMLVESINTLHRHLPAGELFDTTLMIEEDSTYYERFQLAVLTDSRDRKEPTKKDITRVWSRVCTHWGNFNEFLEREYGLTANQYSNLSEE